MVRCLQLSHLLTGLLANAGSSSNKNCTMGRKLKWISRYFDHPSSEMTEIRPISIFFKIDMHCKSLLQ